MRISSQVRDLLGLVSIRDFGYGLRDSIGQLYARSRLDLSTAHAREVGVSRPSRVPNGLGSGRVCRNAPSLEVWPLRQHRSTVSWLRRMAVLRKAEVGFCYPFQTGGFLLALTFWVTYRKIHRDEGPWANIRLSLNHNATRISCIHLVLTLTLILNPHLPSVAQWKPR